MSLPQDKKIVAYVGKYKTNGAPKGVDDIVVAVGQLHMLDSSVALLIVGLNEDEHSEVQGLAVVSGLEGSVYLRIHVPHEEVPRYLRAADVLIMSYPSTEHYAHYMSPLKLFEYMASGVPIVSSDLPSIREVLNENNSILVEPDNPEKLADGIKKVLQNQNLAEKISKQAYEDIKKYTWQKRAEHILNFINEAKE